MKTYVKAMTFQTNGKEVLQQIRTMKKAVKDLESDLKTSISSSTVVSGIKDFAKNFKSISSESIQSFAKSFKTEVFGKSLVDTLTEELNYLKLNSDGSKKSKQQIENKQKQLNAAKQNQNKEFWSKLGKEGGKKFTKMLDNIGSSFKQFFSDLLDDAKEMMSDMASYNLGSTLTYNSNAWDIAMTKGLSGADAYGYQKAMEDIGVSNDEELMQAMMSPALQERFSKRVGYWSNQYDELNQSGFIKSYQEFTTEWKDFKNEMTVDVMKFFVDNKDTIKTVMKGLMNFMKKVIEQIDNILNVFGYDTQRSESQIAARTNDIINNYKTSNSSTNVNVSNTFNVSGNNNIDNAKLKDAGQTVYRQIINALR